MLTRTRSLSVAAARVAIVLLLVVVAARTISQWGVTAEEYWHRYHGESQAGPKEDYVAFYAAAALVKEGNGDQLYDFDAIAAKELELMGRPVGGSGVLPYLNPPFVAAAFAPIGALGPPKAAAVFGLLTLFSVAVVVALLSRPLPTYRSKLTFATLALLFLPVPWLVLHGQLSMVILLGFVSFLILERRGQQRAAGTALALTLIKPQYAILPVALLVWHRRWAELLPFASIAAGLTLVSVAVGGPSVLIDYPRFLLESRLVEGAGAQNHAYMFSWSGFLAGFFSYGSLPHLLSTTVLSLVTVLVLAWAFRGEWAPQTPRFLLQFAALLVGALLITPHLHLQDLVLLGAAVTLGYVGTIQFCESRRTWWCLAGATFLTSSLAYNLLARDINVVTPVIALVFVVAVVESLRLRNVERVPAVTLPIRHTPAASSG